MQIVSNWSNLHEMSKPASKKKKKKKDKKNIEIWSAKIFTQGAKR